MTKPQSKWMPSDTPIGSEFMAVGKYTARVKQEYGYNGSIWEWSLWDGVMIDCGYRKTREGAKEAAKREISKL